MTQKEFLENIKKDHLQMFNIMVAKNADYSGSEAESNPFKNFEACEQIGVCSVEQGILVRMMDKMARITNLTKQEAQVKDESITDTCLDLANYALILKAYIESRKA